MSLQHQFASALAADDATASDVPGTLRVEGTKVYMYVLAEDAAIADGDVVEFSDATGYEVTNDRAGGSSLGRNVAGVGIGAITDGQYGWIQIRGLHTNVKTDGGVSAGEFLIPHATADGQADSGVAGTNDYQKFATALADDDASTPSRVTAYINC